MYLSEQVFIQNTVGGGVMGEDEVWGRKSPSGVQGQRPGGDLGAKA